MNTKRGPNIAEQIITILSTKGPMKHTDMMTHITGVKPKSVHNECLDLEKLGLMSRDVNDVWTLREGVTVETLSTGELKNRAQPPGAVPPPPPTPAAQPIPPPPEVPKPAGMPLDQRTMFMSHLVGIGVQPKEAIPTIADIFFTGDINNLQWLKQVLQKEAPGFTRPDQQKMIISWWAHTRNLPFKEEDFPFGDEEAAKGKKAAEKEPAKSTIAKVMEDTGIAYLVARDKDGVWIPKTGGPLTYEAALDRCERLNAIRAMAVPQSEAEEEQSEEGAEGKPSAKAGKKQESVQDYFMKKMIDEFIDGRKNKGDEESPQFKALQQQLNQATATIQQMRDDQEQARFDRIEANIAQIASQNPWEDPVAVDRLRQRLGIQPSGVTDSSPAVQLIKDATDKMDKSVNRMTGLVERVFLREDVFRPEETRTPTEKETKARDLLDEAQKRQRSTDIRRRAFSHPGQGG